jgi:hypothetical protein
MIAMFSGTEILFSQVAVAPSVLFINGKSGIASLYITNNSSSPQEVNVSFAFGYPDADSAGNAKMVYNDTLAARMYSLNPMVHAYPRSFVLGANEQQTVRLQVRTVSTSKDVFYFTRVKVTSNQKTADIERKVTDSVTAQINFKFDQIFPVFYRKGNVSTGLIVHEISTSTKDNKLTVVSDIERIGTAPFIGSVKAQLFSPENKEVGLSEATTAIYFRMKSKLELDLSKAGKGTHRLLLTFETKRSDVTEDDLLQASPVSKEVTLNLH